MRACRQRHSSQCCSWLITAPAQCPLLQSQPSPEPHRTLQRSRADPHLASSLRNHTAPVLRLLHQRQEHSGDRAGAVEHPDTCSRHRLHQTLDIPFLLPGACILHRHRSLQQDTGSLWTQLPLCPTPACPYLEISSRQELVSAGLSLFTMQARAETTPAVSSFCTRRFTKSGLSWPRGRVSAQLAGTRLVPSSVRFQTSPLKASGTPWPPRDPGLCPTARS